MVKFKMIPWVQAVCDSLKIVLPVRNSPSNLPSESSALDGENTTSDAPTGSEITANSEVTESVAPLDERRNTRNRDSSS